MKKEEMGKLFKDKFGMDFNVEELDPNCFENIFGASQMFGAKIKQDDEDISKSTYDLYVESFCWCLILWSTLNKYPELDKDKRLNGCVKNHCLNLYIEIEKQFKLHPEDTKEDKHLVEGLLNHYGIKIENV